MLPVQIVYFLNIFDVFGYKSGSSKLSQNRKISYFIYFCHIFLATLLTLFKPYSMFKYYSSLGLSVAISEFLEYSTPLCTYWMIIFDFMYHQQTHRLFWKILEENIHQFDQQHNYNFRIFLIKFIEFFGIKFFTLFSRFILYDRAMVGIAYDSLFKLCQIRVFYYLFCLEVVHLQLILIKTELEFLNIEDISIKSSGYVLKLRKFRTHFYFIYEMLESLNKIFGWSQVAAILFCFYLILSEFNWTYINFAVDSTARQISKYKNIK